MDFLTFVILIAILIFFFELMKFWEFQCGISSHFHDLHCYQNLDLFPYNVYKNFPDATS